VYALGSSCVFEKITVAFALLPSFLCASHRVIQAFVLFLLCFAPHPVLGFRRGYTPSAVRAGSTTKAGFAPAPTPPPPPPGLEVGSPMTKAPPAADARHEPGQPPLPSLGDAVRAYGAVSLEPPTPPTTVTAHGLTWAAGGVAEPVGGPVARRTWSVRTLPGEVIFEEGDTVGQTRTPYDYFLAMFPMDQLTRMLRQTSFSLEGRGTQPTTRGELLKFMGVTILAIRYDFSSRAELWSTKPRNPYLIEPAFGERTGLSRCRFDAL